MLKATMQVPKERAFASDAEAEVTIANTGREGLPFHEYRAQRASLVLQIEDESGRRIPMPPPSVPDEYDLAPARLLAPGESVTIRYAGFLDARRPSGRYRVRYFSHHESLGAAGREPIASEWTALDILRPEVRPSPPPPPPGWGIFLEFKRAWSRLWEVFLRTRCDAVLEREVDLLISETITNGFPVEWNGTYTWNARFHVRIEGPQRRIVVTVRIRLFNTTGTNALPWVTAIEQAWEGFKACVNLNCSANGYPIRIAVLYVTSGEHQQVTAVPGNRTLNMNNWSLSDVIDVRHEFGHMLGNKEEYFTVDGVDYGPGRQPTGNIMNNPANPPVANHYWLIQTAVDGLLGINYSLAGGTIRPVSRPCSYI